MIQNKFGRLLIFAILAMTLVACPAPAPGTGSSGGASDSASDSASEGEDSRGHLNVADDYSFGTATTLDPHDPNRFYMYTVMGFESLVTKDVDGNHVPSLAEAWEPNEDATAWTIKLREGVLFHDGSEMTGADVAYSLMRLTDPELNSPLLASYEILQSVDVVSDYEIVANLEPANVDFPEILTAYQSAIMREDGAETVAQDGIGTGPFKITSLDIAGVTELVAHDDYWNGLPASATASIVAISDGEARVQAMLSGQIDFLGVTAEQIELYEDNDDFTIQNFPTGDWHAMVMRTDTAPFDDARVRKAIRVAADREEIIAQALNGNGVVACDSPVWTGDVYRADIDCSQDIELAKSLLAEAGYEDGIDIDIYTSPLHSAWAPMLETYQAQAVEAGIRLNIIQAPSDGFWSDTWMVESFSTTSWGERSAVQILPEAYRGGMSWNETYYNNPEFDELLDAASAEVDTDARIEIYHQLQETLWEDGGSLVPYHMTASRAHKSCLTGLPPIGAFFIDSSTIDTSGC